MTTFPLLSLNSILEREYFLITQLHLGYNEVENMPLEFTEWFYKRRVQDIVDEQEARKNSSIPTF